MKRLTTETPNDNFGTMLNYVYGKDGWAYIRHDGENGDVPLAEWCREQCLRGCEAFPSGEFPAGTPEGIDELLCSCMMDSPGYTVALAYCFACQAVHLRDRLKIYEDLLFSKDGAEQIAPDMLLAMRKSLKNDPLTLEELRKMDGEPVFIVRLESGNPANRDWSLVDLKYDMCRTATGGMAVFELYGKTWIAYRRKPEKEDS